MEILPNKILRYLSQLSQENVPLEKCFIHTNDLANCFNLNRTQASRELNRLVEKDLVIKINTRPVLFASKKSLEEKYHLQLNCKYSGLGDLQNIVEDVSDETVFEQMIGYNQSLAEAVEQLKTAVYYPPNGLPIMLTGETGVGKSYFVQIMYEYCKKVGLIAADAALKIMNCAEYYDNPELLSGFLFGYAKGTFTGAYEDHKGLLEEADGGILFLDEVHRLNAEGQERLFTFMDKGIFSRLGETKVRKASVRLAFATTEKKDLFLGPFLRRIPIHILIPNMDHRSKMEKRQIIDYIFRKECKRIARPLIVSSNVIELLLQAKYKGNVGQMENSIKYACGKALAHHYKQTEGTVTINLNCLPNHLFTDPALMLAETECGDAKITYRPEQNVLFPVKSARELTVFLEKLNQIYLEYRMNPHGTVSLDQLLAIQVTSLMNAMLYEKKQSRPVAFENFIVSTMQTLFREIDQETLFSYDGNFVLCLSHYIYQFVSKGQNINDDVQFEIAPLIKQEYPSECKIVARLLPVIENRLDIAFSKNDQLLIALFLSKLEKQHPQKVRALILAHGYATASSIANLCNRMLGETVYHSIDMPLEATVKDIAEKVSFFLEENELPHGLIILIDMGSLNMIYDELKRIAKIPILFIDQLGTMMALEIGNLIQQHTSLEEIGSRMQENITPNVQFFKPYSQKRQAIITTCMTGVGTAVKIQEILTTCTQGIIDLDIIPIDYVELRESGADHPLFSSNDVLSIVGTENPGIKDTPFILLEELISGDGNDRLQELCKKKINTEQARKINERLVRNFSLSRIIGTLTILDTEKLMNLIEDFLAQLTAQLGIQLNNSRKSAIYVHVACMVERLVRNEEATEYPEVEKFVYAHQRDIKNIRSSFSVLEHAYSVTVPLNELCYVYNILFND